MKTRPVFFLLSLMVFLSQGASFAENGTAVLKSTLEGSKISGQASFQDTPEGLKITATISDASPGDHAIHIHEFGDCGDAGKAAGSHYNPEGAPHGLTAKDGPQHAHAGDLGNFKVGPDGSGKLETVLPGVALSSGKYSVAGRSLVFHEKEDDFSQPAGNAGSRIACGEILLTK